MSVADKAKTTVEEIESQVENLKETADKVGETVEKVEQTKQQVEDTKTTLQEKLYDFIGTDSLEVSDMTTAFKQDPVGFSVSIIIIIAVLLVSLRIVKFVKGIIYKVAIGVVLAATVGYYTLFIGF